VIAYFTDVEGQWDKLVSYTDDNAHVTLRDGALRLADGVTFVFGGDAVDRGPSARRIVALLLRARADYGDRVVLLAGNRDINKLRLAFELTGAPPPGAPTGTRAELLRWIFERTMGASRAFEHRASELASTAAPADDDAVVDSFIADVAPGGLGRAYLEACRLGYRHGATLFVHGGVSARNLGAVPRRPRADSVDAWIAGLNEFYADELAAFARGRRPDELISYQAPQPGLHVNPDSVVYNRFTDDDGNPQLPPADVLARLRADGIYRIVVGHTPCGDCPAIVRDADFEVLLADNSYGRVERGSRVAVDDATTLVAGETVLDDGGRVAVRYQGLRSAVDTPLGLGDRATGQLVKARLADGRYLMFRGLPRREVEQLAASVEDVSRRALVVVRD
jgi:hypothetical protein